MNQMFIPSEAKNTVDFALECILEEKKLIEKMKLSDILQTSSLSDDYIKKLKQIGSRIIDNKSTVYLLYDSKTNSYYKWIDINY